MSTMSSTSLRALYALPHSILTNPYKVGTSIIFILQVGKLEHREVLRSQATKAV